MLKSQEQDEFIAVRVQDPRLQNEGSWNSYVDYKIFLHTNSKAFTAKTSCVRRRYSEFVWLKKKLQKNTGLVPVPDLPKKSLFSFINDDFIERRRKGLQSFLDKVLHMTVCLSDSQLHLFLQTQLPIKHIEDCVQGHTPYTVTEAILTYASSNRGWAQEEGAGAQDLWTAPVTYESNESPAPHAPTLSGLKPPSEFTDVSDLETELILSDTELTGSDLKDDSDQEQKLKENTIQLVLEAESDECEYNVPQIDPLIEELNCEKAVQDITIYKEIERQTFSNDIKNLPNTTPEHTENDLVEVADKTSEDVASISEENIPNAKDQAEITDAIQENGMVDEDSRITIQKEQREETICTDLGINETHLSPSELSEDYVDEVNEIKSKSIHTARAVLILQENEEALITQTTPVMDTVQNVNTETLYENENFDANTADVSTLVLQAIEIDSVQCQENDIIITAQQPGAQ